MKRSSFLKQWLALGALSSYPITALARYFGTKRVDKGFKVDAGKDRFNKSIRLYEGDTFDCKVSTTDTDGDLYIYESIRIKNGGPAEHFHYNEDEWFYVISGVFVIKVGEETYKAKAGDSVFVPRGVRHVWAKVSEGEAKMLIAFQPAGKMEAYFKAVSEGVVAKMSKQEQDEFRKKHGFERTGPALSYLKE